jgi:hypothetical protein
MSWYRTTVPACRLVHVMLHGSHNMEVPPCRPD